MELKWGVEGSVIAALWPIFPKESGTIMSHSMSVENLSRLPSVDKKLGDALAVIHTPRGSPNKYDYDEEIGAFRLAGVLPQGMIFPYDFGFIPSTLGEDGGPLDVLVFLDSAVPVGCVLTIRIIGVIEAKQREPGKDWICADRFLAVATHARTHCHIRQIRDLSSRMVEEIVDFFRHYNEFNRREFKPIDRASAQRAQELIDIGRMLFEAKRMPQQRSPLVSVQSPEMVG